MTSIILSNKTYNKESLPYIIAKIRVNHNGNKTASEGFYPSRSGGYAEFFAPARCCCLIIWYYSILAFGCWYSDIINYRREQRKRGR